MNRLSPWIVRRERQLALAAGLPAHSAFAAAPEPAPEWLGDLRLFLTGWTGGLIFFGTLLG